MDKFILHRNQAITVFLVFACGYFLSCLLRAITATLSPVLTSEFKLNQFSNLDYPAKPRWSLDEDAAFLKGAGVQL